MNRTVNVPTPQEPKFANSNSEDEVPARKQHRAATGDGKKPDITKVDPVFDAIYKNAVLELKHLIYFVDAFPTSTESDNLPRKVYNHGVHSVMESGLFGQDELRGVDKVFDGKWFSCVRTSHKSLVFSITH